MMRVLRTLIQSCLQTSRLPLESVDQFSKVGTAPMCKNPVACLHANKELPKDVIKKKENNNHNKAVLLTMALEIKTKHQYKLRP